MELNTFLISSSGTLILFLIGIIGYFIKRILNDIKSEITSIKNDIVDCYDRLEKVQKIENCEKNMHWCENERRGWSEANKRTLDGLMDGIKKLTLSHDNLCSCLSKYTKGECP